MDQETKVAATKMSIASLMALTSKMTLNEWVALATLIYVLMQAGLLVPKYWAIFKRFFIQDEQTCSKND